MIECTSGWSRRYHDQVDPITTGVRPQRKVWGTQGGRTYKCCFLCNFPDQIIVLITFPLSCNVLSDKCESSIWWLDLVPWNIYLCKCPELHELLIPFPLKNVMHQTSQMRLRLQMHIANYISSLPYDKRCKTTFLSFIIVKVINNQRVTLDSYQNSRNVLSLLFCFVKSLPQRLIDSELQSNVENLEKGLLTMCTAVLAVSALLRDYWIAFSTQTLHFSNFNHVNSFHCWFGKVPDFLQFMTPLSLSRFMFWNWFFGKNCAH